MKTRHALKKLMHGSCGTVGVPLELACRKCQASIQKRMLNPKIKPKFIMSCLRPFDPKFENHRYHGKRAEYEKIEMHIEKKRLDNLSIMKVNLCDGCTQ